MNRIYALELKRIIKSRRTHVVTLLMVIISIFLALLPLYFVEIDKTNANGSVEHLHGKRAIEYLKPYFKDTEGDVTVEKLKNALQTYQDLTKQYGDSLEEDKILDSVYFEKLMPAQALCRLLSFEYSDFESMPVGDVSDFYDKCEDSIKEICKTDKQPSMTRKKALNLYNKVDKPFKYYYGYTRDAFDYVEFCIFFLVLASIVSSSVLFSNNYEIKADYIIRTTKRGKGEYAVSTILADISVCAVVYIVCVMLHLVISDSMFGAEALRASVQTLYMPTCLINLNILGLQIVLAVFGLITMISVGLCTCFLSAVCKKSVTALAISMILFFAPIFVFSFIGSANIASSIFPSGGVALQNSLLYQLVEFRFIKLGNLSCWSPAFTMVATIVEIPVFFILAIVAYNRHKIG